MNLPLHVKRLKFLLALCVCLLVAPQVKAENEGHALSARVAAAKVAGTEFKEVSLLLPAQGKKHPEVLNYETLFRPDLNAIAQLYQTHPEGITMRLRSDDGKEYELNLLESHPLAENATVGYVDQTGRHKAASYDPGVHYQGIVGTTAQSMASVSVFADGNVMILFANEEGNFIVGKLEDGSNNFVFYNDRDMRNRPFSPCGVKDEGVPEPVNPSTSKTTAAMLCNKVGVYWEVTYNVYTAKASSFLATETYMTGLFNQFAAMYANEKIAMELKTLYIWVTQDDMPTGTSTDGLSWILNSWNTVSAGFDGDLAHVITRTTKGRGGLAYVDVLCNTGTNYAYSDIQGSYQTVPTWSWDVEVITHETGHNLGSKHTHWCGWMTGSGGTCGSIDDCTTQEAGPSCSTCGSTLSNSAPSTAWQGTVMSYCHLVARGINLANGFGTLPGNKIRSEVTGASCLNGVISAKLLDTPICSGANGAIGLLFKSDNRGQSPFVYNWSNNAHTQNLKNLTSPGNYSVQIVDANGCTANYGVDLLARPTPGATNAPSAKSPLCCLNNGVPLILSATAPQNLTSCQTVYWLKSSTQPTSFAIAKAIFDSTQASNILPSSNESAINGQTGAELKVFAPASCSAKLTTYYTPIVVTRPRAARNIVSNASGGAAVQKGSGTSAVNIGRYTILPDDQAQPTACDLIDTPASQTISVSVTGYTGRANNMRLAIVDPFGVVVYQRFGLTGNGSYSIKNYEMDGPFLQSLKVMVYDYNCTSTGCTPSTAVVSANRTVSYTAHAATATPGCTIGTSLKVEFSPAPCTKLDVSEVAKGALEARLHPNPATREAILEFRMLSRETARIRVVDMLGRVVLEENMQAKPGSNQHTIPVSGWAKGMYQVLLRAGDAGQETLRLLVD